MNQMKKLMVFTASMLIVLLLGACTEKPMEADENSMVINIMSNANFEFDMLEVRTALGGGGVMNADGSKIQKGQTLSFAYTEEDFPLEGQGEFGFSLTDEVGNSVPLGTLTLELKKNKAYTYEIIGETAEIAELKLVE